MRKIKLVVLLIAVFAFSSTASFAASGLERMIPGKWSTHGGWVTTYGGILIFKKNHTIYSPRNRALVAHWKVRRGSKPVVQISSWNHSRKIRYEVRQKGSHLYMYQRGNRSPHLIRRGKVSGSINSGTGGTHSGGSVSGNIRRTGPFGGFTGYWIPLHKNGKKARKVPFVNGKKHGTGYWFYNTGFVRYKTGWHRGRPHGVETEYWNAPGRRKKATIVYVTGKKNGWEYRYNRRGRRIKSILWSRGRKKIEKNN